MSDAFQSLSHSKWDCKHHVVFGDDECCLGKCTVTLGLSFTRWPGRRRARLCKGTCCQTKSICASPFPPSTRWPR